MEHIILGACYGGFDGVHIALENDDLKLVDTSDDLGLWYDIQSDLDFKDVASVTSYLLLGHSLIDALCDLNLIEYYYGYYFTELEGAHNEYDGGILDDLPADDECEAL